MYVCFVLESKQGEGRVGGWGGVGGGWWKMIERFMQIFLYIFFHMEVVCVFYIYIGLYIYIYIPGGGGGALAPGTPLREAT